MIRRARARDRISTGNLARDFVSVIARADVDGRAIAIAIASKLGPDLTHTHADTSVLTHAHAHAHANVLALALASAHTHARDLALALASAHTHARDLALASDLARDLARVRHRVSAGTAVRDFVDDLIFVTDSAAYLYGVVRPLNASTNVGKEIQVNAVRLAGRIVHLATRILPPQHRARYGDEYRSELYELAAAGTPRRGQMMYALRLLDRAWVLRAELREPVTRRARS